MKAIDEACRWLAQALSGNGDCQMMYLNDYLILGIPDEYSYDFDIRVFQVDDVLRLWANRDDPAYEENFVEDAYEMEVPTRWEYEVKENEQ